LSTANFQEATVAETRNTIRWDSVGADKVKRDYADVTAANDKTAAGFQKTGASATVAGAGVDRLGKSAGDYASRANVAATATNNLTIGLASMARYVAAGALVTLGTQAIRAADQYRVLQGRIAQATRDTGDFMSVSRELFEVSQRTGTALETNVALFQRMAIGAREFGAANADILKVTEAVQKLGIIGGASQSAIAAGTLQLAQGMAAGVLRAEEFNSVIENLPEVAQAIAKGMGMTVGEIRKAVLEGEVLSRDVFVSLLDQAGQVEERFSAVPTSLAQATQKLSDSFAKASGESQGLVETIGLITDGIDVLGQHMDDFFRPMNEFIRTTVKEFRAIYGVMQDILALVGVDVPAMGGGAAEGYRPYDGPRVLVSDRTKLGKGGSVTGPDEKELAKAAKEQEDWQGRIADGWRDLYDKVGEASADFNQKISEDARKAADEMIQADEERRRSIEATIEAIAFETEMIGLSNEAKEKAIALRNMEKGGASPDQLGRAGAAIDANQARQAAQDAADEVQAVWDAARDDFSDSWSDLFYGIFNDGKFRFKDLADSFKSIWARTLADLLTMSIQNSFIKPMFEGLFGGGTGAAGTTGIFGSLGASLFGGGSSGKSGSAAWMQQNVYGPSGNGATGGIGGFFGKPMGASTIGGMLGGAGLGMGLGAMTGSGMAGAAGGAIGAAVGGPIGSIIGGLLGGLLGGMFKSTPKSISSYGTGGIADSMASGGLDVKIGKDMASGVVRALKTFAEQLVTGIESDEFLGIVGQRGKKFFYQAQETDLKVAGKKKYGAVKFDSAEEAIAAAIEAAINSGVVQGLTDADKKLMRAAGSVEQAMQDVVSSHNFKRELDFQYIGLSSPLKEAQARLEFEYQQQLILAEKYEADKTKLEAIYAQKRLDLVEQYNSQQYASLKSFLTSITAGSASSLSPTTRLGLAQANYSALSGKARSGDQDAIAALQGAAQDYLSAGKDVFASGGGYQSIYQQVVADLSSITGVSNPLGVGAAANSNVAAAVNDNTRAQAGWFATAQSQRTATNNKLDTLNANMSALVMLMTRSGSLPTQQGVVGVGTVTWPNLAVNF